MSVEYKANCPLPDRSGSEFTKKIDLLLLNIACVCYRVLEEYHKGNKYLTHKSMCLE